ncbi:MAG: tetratricopeptide repeat protein [Proteobacteria bacterium]|nr:tetratricopeptide repeat protein [Pseudomonadota bacterium]
MTAIAELLRQALEHHQAGRLKEAGELYQRLLAAEPAHAEGLHLMGVLANQVGRADLAVDYIGRAVDIEPNSAIYHNNLGQALMALGRFDAAAASFRQALELHPTLAEGYGNLAMALQQQGKTGDAVALLRRALELKPDFPQAHNNLGNILAARGRFDAAVEHYDRALALAPNDAELHVNRGSALQSQGKLDEAVASYRRAYALRPDDALLLRAALVLPIVPESTGAIDQARDRLADEIAALDRRGITLVDPHKQVGLTCFHLAYHARDDLPLQRAIAALYAKACPSLCMVAPHCRAPAPPRDGPIRIGFASHFFRTHTIARLFQGLIARLSRQRFHVTVFATPSGPDPTRQALIDVADAFVELPVDLAAARGRIAERALDVLVYPDIGMSPLTYFLAFARLAPVQCLSWGHPDTTGIANLDYFLSCDAMEPDGAQAHYGETLVRLPGPTVYYQRPVFDARLKSRSELGLDATTHLYVCPQSTFKFHPVFDAVLAEILRRDPAGRLVLVQGPDPHIDAQLIGRLTRAAPDVAPRIVLLPALNRTDFVALLAASDVMLDPLHYSGGNTSLEAFSVGTPIVTWPGAFMRARHTYGFYRLMGLDDCVARDVADYVAIALRLGTDPVWRAEVSRRIQAASAVLYENDDTVQAIEDFLVAAVARARGG